MESGMAYAFRQMALALFVAYRALRTNETPVACIIIDPEQEDAIVGVGFNGTNDTLNGTRHAEFLAIDEVFDKYIPSDKRGDLEYVQTVFLKLVLYVTVEPCIMCASALKQVGIQYVVYGCGNERFGGNGTVLSVNMDHIENGKGDYLSYGGILRSEAIQLLRNFYIQENESAPVPKSKKNREITDKEFPPNIKFRQLYKELDFKSFYHPCNPELFYVDDDIIYEITPNGQGYQLNQFVGVEDVMKIPGLSRLYGVSVDRDIVKADLELFYECFYDINHQKVDFSKPIITVDQLNGKKRKLST